mmetsp:Transcript_12063/g.35811  ORF Transcript_12063/g.35811 Transcript_12063/m.35811 type:complete len:291 (-) Transcript_12063:311-1183(-)
MRPILRPNVTGAAIQVAGAGAFGAKGGRPGPRAAPAERTRVCWRRRRGAVRESRRRDRVRVPHGVQPGGFQRRAANGRVGGFDRRRPAQVRQTQFHHVGVVAGLAAARLAAALPELLQHQRRLGEQYGAGCRPVVGCEPVGGCGVRGGGNGRGQSAAAGVGRRGEPAMDDASAGAAPPGRGAGGAAGAQAGAGAWRAGAADGAGAHVGAGPAAGDDRSVAVHGGGAHPALGCAASRRSGADASAPPQHGVGPAAADSPNAGSGLHPGCDAVVSTEVAGRREDRGLPPLEV